VARTKLVYPKMPGSGDAPLDRCVAFEKYDGTNLHWVWEPELGWYAFGTRRDRFDLDATGIAAFAAAHVGLEEAAPIFLRDLAEPLTDVLREHEFYDSTEIAAFTEFPGPNSFAGRHRDDDPKNLVLFDIETAAGFMHPETFIDHFAALPIARVVYRGKLTGFAFLAIVTLCGIVFITRPNFVMHDIPPQMWLPLLVVMAARLAIRCPIARGVRPS